MRISYIINTACTDPHVNAGRNRWRQAGYSERYRLLKEKVLPAALSQDFDEIIVCGNFETGTGYQYVPMEPRYRDRRDALWQRELGARYATGDVLVFGHDDHAVASGFKSNLLNWIIGFDTEVTDLDNKPVYERKSWDLLIPKRQHALTGAELNNGKADGYMGGHVLVMKRWLWAQVPWTTLDTEWWDTSMTRMWQEAGGKLVWADDLVHLDVEATENEA